MGETTQARIRQGHDGFSLRRDERVRKRKDFDRIYRQGVRGQARCFTWLVLEHPEGARRLGIAVGKKVGKAVARNRIKRLLREFFRLNKARLPEGCHVVIMARPRLPRMTYDDVLRDLEGLFAKKSHG